MKRDFGLERNGKKIFETFEDETNSIYSFKISKGVKNIQIKNKEEKNEYASSFYIRLTKKISEKSNRFSVNRKAHEKIETKLSEVSPFLFQSQEALRKQISRKKIEGTGIEMINDEFENVISISKLYKDKNPEDFIYIENEGKDMIWAFSSKQMGEVAKKSQEWHIDATYKILKNGRGLWIISTKETDSQNVFPLLFFLIPNEKASTIEIVLNEFKNWLDYAPESFIADCQLSIQNSVESVYDDSKFFLCIFHILRATKKNIEKYISDSNERQKCFNMFYDIAMNVYKEEGVEKKVCIFNGYLNENSIALAEYFQKNYFKNDKI